MPKGNQFTASLADDALTAARAAVKALQGKLAFVPQQPERLLTSATISPERLPLADLALQAADAELLRAKIAGYRALVALRNQLAPELTRLDNALNVLGSDILFTSTTCTPTAKPARAKPPNWGSCARISTPIYAKPNARKAAKAAKAASPA